jgi:hypothetical protein
LILEGAFQGREDLLLARQTLGLEQLHAELHGIDARMRLLLPRDLEKGYYEVPPIARRHLSKPLVRMDVCDQKRVRRNFYFLRPGTKFSSLVSLPE